MDELLLATNPDPESRLAYLLRLPLNGGMVFRTSGTWLRTKALYCATAPIRVIRPPDLAPLQPLVHPAMARACT
jgi:hypothetical protein